jgi:hypothetical protein
MSEVTLIGNLDSVNEETDCLIIEKDKESLYELILDLSLPIEKRIHAIEIYFDNFGQEECNEIINRLSMMYTMSGVKVLEKYLYDLCTKCKISSILKITAAKSLCSFNPELEIGYKALDTVCQDMEDIATPCKLDVIFILMRHILYKRKSLKYFCSIINNPNINCDFRYKAILSIENKDLIEYKFFIKESATEFVKNTQNTILYRILAAQYLVQNSEIKGKELKVVESILMSFAQDSNLDYNTRADSADVLLQLGSDDNKKTARDIIMVLGRKDGVCNTIFDNSQNVHISEIEESVLEALEFLSSIKTKTLSGIQDTPITFEYIKKQIDYEINKSKPITPKRKTKKYNESKILYDLNYDKIKISLNRIYMDRALYSKYSFSLIHILLKIWTYLIGHESSDDMKIRLIEELIDMSGTCSSGFASRLVNVISGYGDFNLSISWRDQIIANFTGRLNARARDISSGVENNIEFYNIEYKSKEDIQDLLENFQGLVLEEMTINTNNFSDRKNFLKFFRKNMSYIREELYEEFKEHIPDSDFDLYFRSAISSYETGGYV